MGLPFLVFAWLMLIQFSSGIAGRKNSKWLIVWFLFINFSILIILGYIIARENSTEPATIIRNYFIIMNLIYSLLASYLIHLPGKGRSVIHEFDSRIISPVLFIIVAAQCVALWFYTSQPWSGLVFIFAFFAGNIFLPVYFSYVKLLREFAPEPVNDISFEEFCMKYEISPRESDIVREICNGLSNKEISEKLFISLQTVKDHTHRIYIKTNVRSRVQLITLVKRIFGKVVVQVVQVVQSCRSGRSLFGKRQEYQHRSGRKFELKIISKRFIQSCFPPITKFSFI